MLDKNRHRMALYRLLTGMLRDHYLVASLGFKGGTACHFFHELPRFSVDLDFDKILEKGKPGDDREIAKHIQIVIKREGLTIRDEMVKNNTVFFMVSYEKDTRNIKIEVSRRDFPNTYQVLDFYGLPVQVLVKPDMFAHKLAAATDRNKTAPRDFFDIWFFFRQGWPINEKIVQLRTGRDLKTYLKDLLDFVRQRLKSRALLQDMGELLDVEQKKWVKTSLLKELEGIISLRAGMISGGK